MAQLQAQAAAIAQEREALSMQRVNTDVLASLSEQVRLCGLSRSAPAYRSMSVPLFGPHGQMDV